MTVPARVSLLTLGVADVARSTAFYEALGWRRSSASTPEITFVHTVGPILALFGRQDLADDATVDGAGEGFRAVTIAVNMGSSDEVDRAYDAWVAAGGRGVRSPGPAVYEGGYMAYVTDPDDHLWELAHNPFFPFTAAGQLDLP